MFWSHDTVNINWRQTGNIYPVVARAEEAKNPAGLL